MQPETSDHQPDHTKKCATDALESTSKRVIQKTAEATGDLIGNKVTVKITKFRRSSPQNSSGTVKNETANIGLDGKIPKER